MFNRRNLFLAMLLILCLVNSLLIANLLQSSRKTVVIDIMKVVDEFHLKKDLEGRAARKLESLSNEIDSLTAIQRLMLTKGGDKVSVDEIGIAMDTLRARAQRAYLTSNQTINEQIWQRLNSLLTEYGKSNGYRLVIGANGMGTVLYNEEQIDKTKELIEFINRRYDNGH